MDERGHSLELSAGEDRAHDGPQQLPRLALEVGGHVHGQLVDGVGSVEADAPAVGEVVKVLDGDGLDELQVRDQKVAGVEGVVPNQTFRFVPKEF